MLVCMTFELDMFRNCCTFDFSSLASPLLFGNDYLSRTDVPKTFDIVAPEVFSKQTAK